MAAQGRNISCTSIYQRRSIMQVELGQSSCILPRNAVPCLLFLPVSVCSAVGSQVLQPHRDLDEMETLLHSASGAEMGFGRARENGGGPAWEMGQDPCLMSYLEPMEPPAHSELCETRWAHVCPPGEGTLRTLLLTRCLQPS